jgi:hypothetical protein
MIPFLFFYVKISPPKKTPQQISKIIHHFSFQTGKISLPIGTNNSKNLHIWIDFPVAC